MPVLEYAEDYDWYTMPVAQQVLDKLDLPLPDEMLRELVGHTIEGLDAAHQSGYVHRDISPRNLLRVDFNGPLRWVVSDWGMVKRPRGQTTAVRTFTGTPIGTEGFAAPETWIDAHDVDARADIYSLGRVVAWAVTGQWPIPNVDLLPDGRWRAFVRAMTRRDPQSRPADMAAVLALLEATVAEPVETVYQRAEGLLAAATADESGAAAALCELALESPSDASLYIDYVSNLPIGAILELVKRNSDLLRQILDNMEPLFRDDDYWRYRNYDHANYPLKFVSSVAQCAVESGDDGLLEDAATVLFVGEPERTRYRQRDRSRVWLRSLRGHAAEVVARALRRYPRAVAWYREGNWQAGGAEPTILASLGINAE
jgi:serine/threonine protein kinase